MTVNHLVGGSSPSRGARYIKHLADFTPLLKCPVGQLWSKTEQSSISPTSKVNYTSHVGG